jgi:hypothetical protein
LAAQETAWLSHFPRVLLQDMAKAV